MNIHDYLIDQSGLDWASLLANWSWLLPPKFIVWLLTRAGDLILQLPDDSIHLLNVGAGELNKIANSRDDACAKIDQPEVAADWLMIPVVDRLVASGVILQTGQCYSYRMLPILGGSYGSEGRVVLSIHVHFSGRGTVHQQIANLPECTEIRIKPSK
jgi:hypothetical protein